MEIPAILRKKVVRVFGSRGEAWLAQLPALYADCVEKWHLNSCQLSDVISFNLVCFADSPDYGPVVLKIGMPERELFTEIEALTLYQGRLICKLYESDANLGAMLLERIRPGHDLTRLEASSERITAAATVVPCLPVPVATGSGLPLLADLLKRAFSRLRAENTAGPQMLALASTAQDLFSQLGAKPSVLLHGDLNHWNILQAEDDQWRAIDPKGIIGPACMEAGRFIINELDMVAPDNRVTCLNEATATLGAGLGETPKTIALCAFIDKVLSTCWKFEEVVPRDRTEDLDQCELLLTYYRSM